MPYSKRTAVRHLRPSYQPASVFSLITHIVIHGGLRCYHVPPHKGKKNPSNQVLFKLSLVLEIIVFKCRWQVAGTPPPIFPNELVQIPHSQSWSLDQSI